MTSRSNDVFVVSGETGGRSKGHSDIAGKTTAGKECKCSLIYAIVVVVLAALISVTGSMCLFFCLRVQNAKKKQEMDNEVYSS